MIRNPSDATVRRIMKENDVVQSAIQLANSGITQMRPVRVYDKKVTLSGKVAHAAVRAAALNEERLREA